MKSCLAFILKILARAIIRKYQPRIIGITGSVGKTSTKNIIAAILSKHLSVRQSPQNLNNEIGLPLAIIGANDSGYANIFIWFKIIAQALTQIIFTNNSYPKILILEYGVDHVGDMKYLLSIAQPETAVITAVSPVHLEFINTIENIEYEKSKLVSGSRQGATTILNIDDARVAAMRSLAQGRVITFGLNHQADVRAEQILLSRDTNGTICGLSFKLIIGGSTVPVLLSGVIGKPVILTALAGAAIGVAYNIPVFSIVETLQSLSHMPGRMRILQGIKNTILIDDTYNSSPKAADEALVAVSEFPMTNAHRWVILGDMLELGKDSNSLHKQVGQRVANLDIDYLIGVGDKARQIIDGALEQGFNCDHAWHFERAEEVGIFIQNKLQTGDVILIKGSQGVRCEKITKELIAEPARAAKLLVRQYKPWI